MKDLRYEISDIIGVTIPPGKWSLIFDEANSAGRLDLKTVLKIIVAILKYLDKNDHSTQNSPIQPD